MDNQPRRQLIIETDGKDVVIMKNEVTPLELYAILHKILETLNKQLYGGNNARKRNGSH